MVTKSPELLQFETRRDQLKALTDISQLGPLLIEWKNSPSIKFNAFQDATMDTLVDETRKALTLKSTYKDIDAENFPTPVPPAEIVEVNLDDVETTPEVTPTANPSEATANPTEPTAKRTRKTKEDTQVVQSTPTLSYKLSRRVNRPIDWVQYSNNEYSIEVTATDKETLIAELDSVQELMLSRIDLYTKEQVTKLRDEAYAKGKSEVPKPTLVAPVQVASPESAYNLACYERLNKCLIEMFAVVPGSKEFYTAFAKTNPKPAEPTKPSSL